MFSSTVKNVNTSGTVHVVDKSQNVNKVAPGFSNGGSFWERLTGQR
jgi:hypothetical protein